MTDSGTDAVYIVGQGGSASGAIRELVAAGAGWTVRGFAGGPDWIAAASLLPPGCVLFDWGRADTGLLDTLRQTVAADAGHVAIVLAAPGDVADAVAVMQAGAGDLLSGPFASADLARAIEEALAGLRSRAERRNRATRALALAGQLSPVERRVLAGLVAGQSTASIARHLDLDMPVVAACRARLIRLTGAGGLVGLIRVALDAGLLDVA